MLKKKRRKLTGHPPTEDVVAITSIHMFIVLTTSKRLLESTDTLLRRLKRRLRLKKGTLRDKSTDMSNLELSMNTTSRL